MYTEKKKLAYDKYVLSYNEHEKKRCPITINEHGGTYYLQPLN
jgi:hypothetical protein